MKFFLGLFSIFAAIFVAVNAQTELPGVTKSAPSVHGLNGELNLAEHRHKEVEMKTPLLPNVTPVLMAGLLAGLFFFMVLCCGVGMLSNLDTPKKFAEKGLTGRFDF